MWVLANKKRMMSILLLLIGICVITVWNIKNWKGDNQGMDNFTVQEKSDVMLLFEIDEGIGGVELTSRYRNNRVEYDNALNNVYSGIKPFTQKFNVGVLIYPQHGYKHSGYGHHPGEPLDRISPELLHALDFFASKGDIKVYLEMHSSGIYTNQNGELANLKPAPLYAADPEDKLVKGLPMDMDTLEALKQAYHDTVWGIRFHELIGTDELGEKNDPHAFIVQPSIVKTMIDTCKRNDLKLIWSDPGWNFMNYKAGKRDMWENLKDYAKDQLKENITFNWANNNFGVKDALGNTKYHEDMKKSRQSNWGISVQSWFWVSMVASNWKWSQGNHKFYHFIEDGMPIELMASFTLMGIKEGAKVIQYEPSWYFFNFHQPPWLIQEIRKNPFNNFGEGYTGNYEQAPDFSPRLSLKRLASILLEPEGIANISSNVLDYFGGGIDYEHWWKNTEDNPPEKFHQTTLNIANAGGYMQHFDFYNNGISWAEQNKYRFGDWIFDGDVLAATRINLRNDPHDEMLIVKEKDGERIVEFYNQMSGLMAKNKDMAADNEEGRFLAVTSANLISEYVTSLDGDPDEIIVIRKKDGQPDVNIRIYKVTNGLRANYLDFGISALPDDQNNAIIKEFIGRDSMKADSFVSLAGLRFGHTIYSDLTRGYDGIAVLLNNSDHVQLRVRRLGKDTILDLDNVPLEDLLLTTADIDCDYTDEISILMASPRKKAMVASYKLKKDSLHLFENKEINLRDGKPAIFFSLKKSSYHNAAINLKKPDNLIEGQNLALNAKIEMNSGSGGSRVVDGNYNSFVSAKEKGANLNIKIDLGKVKEINRVSVVNPRWDFAGGYMISVSTDGNIWTEVAAETGAISEVRFIYDFDTIKARYIMFQSTRISGAYCNVSEIEVFNTTPKQS